ncbi:CobW/HypB/UreG, nucleotide-binding domain-containing protein [Phyllosticta citriasiana]|uniref:CobW/HypB/UreG, nucleotide-binding domain-containing protein n=1 Tax=Phyllosticta citriasiana TaxID=595635 RepID=UPI0030FD221F
MEEDEKPLLPVTVLSGFLVRLDPLFPFHIFKIATTPTSIIPKRHHLHSNDATQLADRSQQTGAAAKQTLLKHILHSDTHGLKIAIIVNDMAEVNIDGAHIARLSTKNEQENLVQMQNGCICCTLRGDFLVELANMAWSKQFDYVLIESSGISEPQQVAETFSAALSAEMLEIPEAMEKKDREVVEKIANAGGLETVARIDTMVTVVDAFRFFAEFNTGEFLTDRFGRDEVPPEDERTISDLMADQLEFANVIIINKTDAIDRPTLARIHRCITNLNPKAKIIETKFGRVEPKELVGTRSFNLEEAQMMSGWLASLHEMFLMDVNGKKKLAPKPETLEYGIGSFVYRARRPFDPMRLYRLLAGKFVLIQPDPDEDEDEEDGKGDGSEDEASEKGTGSSASLMDVDIQRANTSPKKKSRKRRRGKKKKKTPSSPPSRATPASIVAAKAASPLWAKMHRSKGWLWFATRPTQAGSWNTAGAMLRIEYEQDWFCCMEPEEWGADDPDVRKAVEKDFEGEWGDRRQEIVFIGEDLDKERITRELDACLLTKREFGKWERLMRRKDVSAERKEDMLSQWWDDSYWAEWTVGEEEGGGGGGGAGGGHQHHGHNHAGHNHKH